MQLTGESLELADQPIALCPERDRAGHVAHVPEVPEQRCHLRDVIGMDAAAQESLADDLEVRVRLLELEARLAVTERNIDRPPVELEILFVVRCRVASEVVDARLLRLRPESLAAHVASHRVEDRGSEVGRDDRAADDRDEQHDQQNDTVTRHHGAEELVRRAHATDCDIPHLRVVRIG